MLGAEPDLDVDNVMVDDSFPHAGGWTHGGYEIEKGGRLSPMLGAEPYITKSRYYGNFSFPRIGGWTWG